MDKLTQLRRSATSTAATFGHTLGRFQHHRFSATAECTRCRRAVTVNAKPAPNETDIAGRAIAEDCTPHDRVTITVQSSFGVYSRPWLRHDPLHWADGHKLARGELGRTITHVSAQRHACVPIELPVEVWQRMEDDCVMAEFCELLWSHPEQVPELIHQVQHGVEPGEWLREALGHRWIIVS